MNDPAAQLPTDYVRAKRRLEVLLPGVDTRTAVLERVRQSILRAHAQGTTNWDLTLNRTSVRLNAGTVQAISVRPTQGITIAFDGTRLAEGSALGDLKLTRGVYKKFPEVVDTTVPPDRFPSLYDSIRDAHFAFLERAARSRCPYLNAHSFGLIRIIADTTGRDVPNPDGAVDGANASYWKVAPGHGARLWEKWQELGIASIGWEELGDISGLSKSEFNERVARVQVDHPDWTRAALNQVWKFSRIQPGDRIIANGGTSRVLGVGTVVGGYRFDSSTSEHGHRVDVRWEDTKQREVDKPGWRRTLVKLRASDFREVLQAEEDDVDDEADESFEAFSDIISELEDHGLHFPEELVANFLLALQTKRFVIFTGISGTGKTQLAIQVARHFSPDVVDPPRRTSERVEVEIKPYVQKYARMVIPAALASDFLAFRPSGDAGRWLPVELPDGLRAQVATHTRDDTNLLQALFHGPVRAWFKERAVGDVVELERVGGADELGHLRIGLAASPTAETAPAYEVIPVRPDWSDNTGLLGFYNPLTEHYTVPAFLRLVLAANAEAQAAEEARRAPRPFFAILDEMNLARVEHYFSDILSAMESSEPLELHDVQAVEDGATADGNSVPRRLVLPANLFIVGTVNVDETTYMFSPKVLDRAFTIEFNDVALHTYGVRDESAAGDATPLSLDQFQGSLRFRRNPSPTDWGEFCGLDSGAHRESVIALNAVLEVENRHFGYRVANEIARFVCLARQQSSDVNAISAAYDLAILQKVLPKLHGTQQEIEDVLVRLFGIATNSADADPRDWTVRHRRLEPKVETDTDSPASTVPFPRTAMKLFRMCRRLRQQGFASFIE